MTNGVANVEKSVVLAEYLEQQPDCNEYKRKISKTRRSPWWSYLPFIFKHMETKPWSYQHSTT